VGIGLIATRRRRVADIRTKPVGAVSNASTPGPVRGSAADNRASSAMVADGSSVRSWESTVLANCTATTLTGDSPKTGNRVCRARWAAKSTLAIGVAGRAVCHDCNALVDRPQPHRASIAPDGCAMGGAVSRLDQCSHVRLGIYAGSLASPVSSTRIPTVISGPLSIPSRGVSDSSTRISSPRFVSTNSCCPLLPISLV